MRRGLSLALIVVAIAAVAAPRHASNRASAAVSRAPIALSREDIPNAMIGRMRLAFGFSTVRGVYVMIGFERAPGVMVWLWPSWPVSFKLEPPFGRGG